MSVRSEAAMNAVDVSNAQGALMTGALMPANDHVTATVDAARAADSALGESNSLNTGHPEHPLRRTFVANVRASLGELCLRKTKGTWAPSGEALRSIFQQRVSTAAF